MTANRIARTALLLGVAATMAAATGCSGCGKSEPHVVPLSQSEKNLRDIVMAYMDAHEKLGRGPKNADELKPYLKEHGNPDEILVSPNDGEPYVIVWGVDPSRGGPTDYQGMWQIIAYEKKGSGGKRAVTDVRGRPLTVPDEDFPKLKFAGRHNPSAN
jgi:hypothetical protein